jgi:hypothetical protein
MRAQVKQVLLLIGIPVVASIACGVDTQATTTPAASTSSCALVSSVSQPITADVSATDHRNRSQDFRQSQQ